MDSGDCCLKLQDNVLLLFKEFLEKHSNIFDFLIQHFNCYCREFSHGDII